MLCLVGGYNEIDLFYYGGDEDNDKVIREDLQSVFGEITKIRQTPAWKYYPLRLLQETSLIHSLKGKPLFYLDQKTYTPVFSNDALTATLRVLAFVLLIVGLLPLLPFT